MPSFYFDPTRNGGNSTGVGTEANPYFNQAHLYTMPLAANTTLLFRRGTVWRPGLRTNPGNSENFLIPRNLFTHNNAVVEAYGTGSIPVIDGSIDLTGWSLVSGYTDVYSVVMPGLSAMWCRPGNITQGTSVPFFVRWQGSLASTLSAAGSRPLVQSCDFGSGTWYIKTPNNPNTTTVQASYWRWLMHNENNAAKRTGCVIRDLGVRRFSSNPWIVYGLDGMLIERCEGRYVGGLFRPDQNFYEGNWIDIREGNDNIVIQDCTVEDIFDAGISPQFASQWGAPGGWTSLSNVLIRRNTIRRCGLAGVENVIQQSTVDRIDGVFIEYNTFEECGKGPFGPGSTWGGDGSAVNSGQNGGGNQSALCTNVHVRYNRIINCQGMNGDFKGPAQHFFYGNVCTMSPSFSRPQDICVRAGWTVSHVEPGPQRVRAFGNVIVGYPTAMSVNFANFAVELTARYNTFVDCPIVFQGNGLSNVTTRISNNTIHNATTVATGWGNSSFASQGGNRLSSVTTAGFTLNGADVSGQAAPVFVAGTYIPVEGSSLYSGGVTGFAEYGDPNRNLFSAHPGSRNAYATYALGAGSRDIMCIGDSLTQGASADNPLNYRSYRGRLQELMTAANVVFDMIGPNTVGQGGGVDTSHAGYVGDTIVNIDAKITTTILTSAYDPEIIILWIGWNGISSDSPTQYQALFDKIRAAKPSAKIALCTLSPAQGFTEAQMTTESPNWPTLNTRIREIVTANQSITALCDLARVEFVSTDYTDYIHFNQTGANKVASAIYTAMVAANFFGSAPPTTDTGGTPPVSGYVWDQKKVDDASITAALVAVAAAGLGTKNAAYRGSLSTSMGSNFKRQLWRDGVKVWEATTSGGALSALVVGNTFVLSPTASQTLITVADIDSGTWIHRIENASDATRFIATQVGKTGQGLPGALSDDLIASGGVILGSAILTCPNFD